MAIRFVDFGYRLDRKRRMFGFWEEAESVEAGGYFTGGSDAFESWGDFEKRAWFAGNPLANHPATLARFRAACPPWVFGDNSPPEDIPGLVRVLGDAAEGNPDAADQGLCRAAMDAAAEIERLQAENEKLKAPMVVTRTILPGSIVSPGSDALRPFSLLPPEPGSVEDIILAARRQPSRIRRVDNGDGTHGLEMSWHRYGAEPSTDVSDAPEVLAELDRRRNMEDGSADDRG